MAFVLIQFVLLRCKSFLTNQTLQTKYVAGLTMSIFWLDWRGNAVSASGANLCLKSQPRNAMGENMSFQKWDPEVGNLSLWKRKMYTLCQSDYFSSPPQNPPNEDPFTNPLAKYVCTWRQTETLMTKIQLMRIFMYTYS